MEEIYYTYAGFWKRFFAYFIDSIILNLVIGIISIPIFVIFGAAFIQELEQNNYNLNTVSYMQPETVEEQIVLLSAFIVIFLIITVVSLIISWLYFALMESSSKKATLGKLALNLIVTDINGARLTFGRATGRFFGKILSSLILNIGFIMAAFTEKKQALHDILANTLVLEKKNSGYY